MKRIRTWHLCQKKKAENPPFMKAQISFLKNCRGRVQFPQMECKKIVFEK